MTLLELMLGITVLVVGLLSYAQVTIGTLRSQALTREKALATEAARRVIEEMKAGTFVDVFRQFNATAADDLPGAPGSGFAVAGLDAAEDDADGLPGSVIFPTPVGLPGALTEQWADASFGPQLDIDGQNGVDAADHALDYQLLPTIVRVRWRNRTGAAEVELRTILGDVP